MSQQGFSNSTFDGKERRWELQPSPVKWADGAMLFSGEMKDVAQGNDPPQWRFALDGKNGVFEAAEFDVPPVTIDSWRRMAPSYRVAAQSISMNSALPAAAARRPPRLRLKAGPQGQSMAAEFHGLADAAQYVEGSLATALGNGAREWIGKNVSAVDFKGGTLRFTSNKALLGGDEAEPFHRRSAFPLPSRQTMLVFQPLPGMPDDRSDATPVNLKTTRSKSTCPTPSRCLRMRPARACQERPASAPPIVHGAAAERRNLLTARSDLGPFIETIETLPVRAVRGPRHSESRRRQSRRATSMSKCR